MLLFLATLVLGSLDRPVVVDALEKLEPELSTCFAGRPSQTVTAKLFIGHPSHVIRVDQEGDRLDGDVALRDCLEAGFRRLELPVAKCDCGVVIITQTLEWRADVS